MSTKVFSTTRKKVLRSSIPVRTLGVGETLDVEEAIFDWGVDVTDSMKNLLTGDKIAVVVAGTGELVRQTIPRRHEHDSRATDESIRVLETGDVFGLFEWVDSNFDGALSGRSKDQDVWKIYAGLVTCTPFCYEFKEQHFTSIASYFTNKFKISPKLLGKTDFPLPRSAFQTDVLKIWLLPSNEFEVSYLTLQSMRALATFVNLSSRFAQNRKYGFMPKVSDFTSPAFKKMQSSLKSFPVLGGVFFDSLYRTFDCMHYGEVGYRKLELKGMSLAKFPPGLPTFLLSKTDMEYFDYFSEARVWPLMVPTKIRAYSGATCKEGPFYFPIGLRSPFFSDLKYSSHPVPHALIDNAPAFFKEMFRKVQDTNFVAVFAAASEFLDQRLKDYPFDKNDLIDNGWIC